jgi:hypothetical protein
VVEVAVEVAWVVTCEYQVALVRIVGTVSLGVATIADPLVCVFWIPAREWPQKPMTGSRPSALDAGIVVLKFAEVEGSAFGMASQTVKHTAVLRTTVMQSRSAVMG